jgi:predicted anti-sigma-YlaC factor YlaD
MDCAQSLELLSDYSEGGLAEADKVSVSEHLSNCVDCDGVMKDIRLIVEAARALRNTNGFQYPDENVVWQRLGLDKGPVH